MKKSIQVKEKDYDTEKEGAEALREIFEKRDRYPHGSSGIYRDLQELPEGFDGLYRGVYVKKPIYDEEKIW